VVSNPRTLTGYKENRITGENQVNHTPRILAHEHQLARQAPAPGAGEATEVYTAREAGSIELGYVDAGNVEPVGKGADHAPLDVVDLKPHPAGGVHAVGYPSGRVERVGEVGMESKSMAREASVFDSGPIRLVEVDLGRPVIVVGPSYDRVRIAVGVDVAECDG
jgi:hypothetical protein